MIYHNTNLFELLTYNTQEYNNIMVHMLNDDFFIPQEKTYDIIQLLYSNNHLAGYIASTILEDTTIQINLIYILPNYRGNNLFVEYLKKDYIARYDDVVIDRPNRFTINTLLKNGLAEYISSDVVETSVLLSYTDYEKDELVVSNQYDLKKCGVVSMDCGVVRLSPLQEVDVHFFHGDYYRFY